MQLPKITSQQLHCQYRHPSSPLDYKIRLHPRDQFRRRHDDSLSLRAAAIICPKEFVHVALRMGDQQQAVFLQRAKVLTATTSPTRRRKLLLCFAGIEGSAIAPDAPGHGVVFDWAGLELLRA